MFALSSVNQKTYVYIRKIRRDFFFIYMCLEKSIFYNNFRKLEFSGQNISKTDIDP